MKIFGRHRKKECHRIQEMFSPYLDGRLTTLEQDAVQFHIEVCEGCAWELRSLGATVQVLNSMPAVSLLRSFTLAEAPPRRNWNLFDIPVMKRLRLATAFTVVLLAVLLAGDFTGLFYRDAIIEQPEVEVAVPADPVPECPEGDIPVQVEDPPGYIADLPPEAREPVDGEIMEMVEPGQVRDQQDVPLEMPEATAPAREPYPWLRPLQLSIAALLVILGVANVLVWQRRRGFTLN